jgi:hypothetical protein
VGERVRGITGEGEERGEGRQEVRREGGEEEKCDKIREQ